MASLALDGGLGFGFGFGIGIAFLDGSSFWGDCGEGKCYPGVQCVKLGASGLQSVV